MKMTWDMWVNWGTVAVNAACLAFTIWMARK